MSTLAEITGVERDDLKKKFQLEPQFLYDPNRSDNLAFMSPLVLLRDSELNREDIKIMDLRQPWGVLQRTF